MDNTQVIEPITQPVPDGTQGTKPVDPFVLGENDLASLSPEQRASLDPILDNWKKRANDEITKRESTASEKYKPLEEKATAFDNLSKWAPFQQWWTQQQAQAQSGATPQQAGAIQQSKPQDVATPEEWQNALYEISQGNPGKLNELQARMMAAWATPFVQKTTEEIQYLKTEREFDRLMIDHPDAKELDKIGLDNKNEGTSILEFCLEWAENNRRPLEDGYKMARRWADSLSVGAKQAAMGMVQDKRAASTSGPGTSSNGQTIIEVESTDELMKRSMEAALSGQKDVKFQIRKK